MSPTAEAVAQEGRGAGAGGARHLAQLAFTEAVDGIFWVDRAGRVLDANPAACRALGYSREQLLGLGIGDICVEITQDEVEGFLAAVKAKGAKRGVLRHRTRDGRMFPAEVVVKHVLVEGQDRFVAFARDIRSRRTAEDELRDSERRLFQALESFPAGVLMVDARTKRAHYMNAMAREMIGVDLARDTEWADISRTYRAYVAGTDQVYPMERAPLGRALRGETWETDDIEIRRPDRTIPLHVKASPIFGSDGEVEYAVSVFHDWTDRKRAQEALRESEARFRDLFESSTDAICITTLDGRVVASNPALMRLLDMEGEDPRRFDAREVYVDPADRHRFLKELESQGEVHDFPVRIRTRSGGERDCIMSATMRSGPDAQPQIQATLRDVTEQKKLQAELNQANKLEAMGRLAAGIAHEINTPIQYVGDNTRFLGDGLRMLIEMVAECRRFLGEMPTDPAVESLRDRLASPDIEFLLEEIPQAIVHSQEGVRKVAEIVAAMKEFSQPGLRTKVPVDLNRAIQNTLTVARNSWKHLADVELGLDPRMPLVTCNEAELNQVLLALLTNAVEAIARTGRHGENRGSIRISTSYDPDAAGIRISDTGDGIPEELLERIFEPFFTTKEVGQGVGQGLAIARSVVVDGHGGSIRIEDNEPEGTVFTIRLPLMEKAAAARDGEV